MKFVVIAAAAALSCVSVAPAFAFSNEGPAANNAHTVQTAATNQQGVTRKDGKICRKEDTTGSRLGGHTTCRTKVEWDEMAAAARKDVEHNQGNRTPSKQ